VFLKRRIGINPFLGVRDWGIFLGIYTSALMLLYFIFYKSDFDISALPYILLGALLGSFPSVAMCFPVHGRVTVGGLNKFHEKIENMGFHLSTNSDTAKIYFIEARDGCDGTLIESFLLLNLVRKICLPLFHFLYIRK